MSITSANAVLYLGVTGLYPTPQKIEGFAADDIFDTEALEVGDTMMGVDGYLSGGFVRNAVVQGYSIMADSPSTDFFDQWVGAEDLASEKYPAFGTIFLPGTGRKYAMTKGILVTISVLPDAKKLLQPRKFTVRWQRVSPAPV